MFSLILQGHEKTSRSGRVFSAPSLFFCLDSGTVRHPVSDFGIVHLHRGVKAAYL